MKNYYKFAIYKIGEIIKNLDKETKIIILSDYEIKKLFKIRFIPIGIKQKG